MAVIGQINTIVSATTKPFTAGLNRAAGSLKSFGGRIASGIGRVGAFGGALVAAAGAAGFGAMIKSSLDTIDSLAKTADALGITTEGLAGLRRASELSGVESDKLDKSIFRMQRSISDASLGLTTAKRDFDQLGLSIDHLRGLSPEEQFIQVADAIAKIPDQTDRTRLAMDTFGRDGARVLKLVENGAQSLRDEVAKAGALGLAPSREEAAKIEAANDAITDMKSAFVGIANTVAINVAPAITSIAGTIQSFAVSGRTAVSGIVSLIRQFGNLWSTIFSQAWETASIVFELLGMSGSTTFKDMTSSVLDFLIGAEFAFKNVGPLAELAWEKAKLGALSFWEDTKFLFTTQLPEAVSWFADNFGNILRTAIDYSLTVFTNLGKNIRSIWSGVLSFFKGQGFQVDWTPLQEGFKSQISELPKLSERELTVVEKRLQSNVDRMGADLNNSFNKFSEMRKQELLGSTEIQPTDAQALADNLGQTIQDSVQGGIKGAVEGPAALQRGSSEAFSAIVAAQRSGNKPLDMLAKNGQKQLQVQESQLTTLKKMERSGGVELVGGTI